MSDYEFSHWSVLTECHLVVVTVNGPDTQPCAAKLADTLANHKYIPVFSLQRGLRFGSILSDEIEAKGITMIEAVVGFSVVLDPKYNALKPTTRSPAVVYERLSKEDVKYADGPLRLLETMNVDVYFRKVLTRK